MRGGVDTVVEVLERGLRPCCRLRPFGAIGGIVMSVGKRLGWRRSQVRRRNALGIPSFAVNQ